MKPRRLNLRRVAWSMFLGVASGAFGWLLHLLCGSPAVFLSTEKIVPLEYFLGGGSFSEMDNAKAVLRAECARFLTELRSRHTAAIIEANAGLRPDSPAADRRTGILRNLLRRLEERMPEFRCPEVESLLVREKLILLNASGRYAEWLNYYLKILYEDPTHEVVGGLADRALSFGKATGREREVLQAFGHVARVPYDLAVKKTLEAAVNAHQSGE